MFLIILVWLEMILMVELFIVFGCWILGGGEYELFIEKFKNVEIRGYRLNLWWYLLVECIFLI